MRSANARASPSVGRNTTLRTRTVTWPGSPATTRTDPNAFSTSTGAAAAATGWVSSLSKENDGP
jgi:hypothetical protein